MAHTVQRFPDRKTPVTAGKLTVNGGSIKGTSDKRSLNAAIRRSKVIECIQQGYTIEQAIKQVDVTIWSYYQWRAKYPEFKELVDLARQNYLATQSPEDVKLWRTFIEFRKKFFRFDTYYHQGMIVDAIESAKEMEIVLILVPPEFGKTTLLEDKICEILARDPDHRIAYISESAGHSRKVGSRIRRRMTDKVDFGEYIARYGPFYDLEQEKQGKPWTVERFTVFKASHDERDYSYEARGAKSNIQGSRVDTLFIDDLQSLKTLNATQDILDKMRQEWLTRVGKVGRTIIVGTRVGVGDIYEKLIELDLVSKLIQLPAVDKDGHSLCPEMWSDEDLAKRRKQVGEQVWARSYQQDPISSQIITFTEEIIEKSKNKERTIKKLENKSIVMSLDPALRGGNTITVCAFTPVKMFVLDQVTDYDCGRTETIIDRVAEYARLYRPQDLIIEMMSFQQALGKDDRMLDLAAKLNFRIYPHVTTDNKYDPDFGVSAIANAMNNGELDIPWGDQHAIEIFQPLFDEMRKWRPHVRGVRLRQDRVMSLWFAFLFWYRQKQVLEMEAKRENIIRVRRLPFKPTQYRRR